MADLFNFDLSPTPSTKTSTSSDGLLFSPAIRKCDLDDIELILGLARDFHSSSIWSHEPFNREAVRGMLQNIIPMGGVYTNETGFIAGMLTPLYFSPNTRVATELAWWAPSGGGRELREAFETWAREAGAALVQCSALADENFEDVNRNFNKAGYKLAELSYVKEL